jgi:hypothetical protein
VLLLAKEAVLFHPSAPVFRGSRARGAGLGLGIDPLFGPPFLVTVTGTSVDRSRNLAVAIVFTPTKHLVRAYVVAPGNQRNRTACSHDAAKICRFNASGNDR